MLTYLTQKYITAFVSKDVTAIDAMLSTDARLSDPMITAIGKENVAKVFGSIFHQFKALNFIEKNTYINANTSIIEFELILDETRLIGVYIIEWQGDKIQELRAYLHQPKKAPVQN